jgi:hypothetical protein
MVFELVPSGGSPCRNSAQGLESASGAMYSGDLRKEALGFLDEPVYNIIDSRGVFEDPRGGRP